MAKTLKEWWEDESLINRLFVKPMVDLATLPGQVNRGEVELFDPATGHTSQDLIERAANAAGTIPLSGLGAGIARPAAETLFSGSFPEKSPWTPEMMELIKANANTVPVKPKPVDQLEEEMLKLLGPYDPNFVEPKNWAEPKNIWEMNAAEAAKAMYAADHPEENIWKMPPPKDWGLPSDPVDYPIGAADEVPFYTGDPAVDAKLAKAAELGWDPQELAHQYKASSGMDLDAYTEPEMFQKIAANFPEHPWFAAKPQTADEILKPKPLDTEKYPWLAKPQVPKSLGGTLPNALAGEGLLDRYDPLFRPVREQLYLKGMDQDPLIRIQELAQTGRDEDLTQALEMSSELRALLPKDWDLLEHTQSTVVPHAFDVTHLKRKGESYEFPELNIPEEQYKLAEEAGFDTSQLMWRGTQHPTDRFLDPSMKADERGVFLGPTPDIGSAYGRYVYPVWSRAKNPVDVDFAGKEYGAEAPGPWSSGDVNRHIEEARRAGHDVLNFRNLRDDDPSAPRMRSTQDQFVLFDPALLRSPWAKFDKNRLNENNLLASQVGGVNPFSWLVPEEEKRKQLGQYRF